MGKIAFLFPGQGSQYVGMGQDVINEYPEAAKIFAAADQRLDYPLSKVILEGPDEQLTLTENTQPGILTVSVALLKLLEKEGITPDYTAGHSLGEYSALVASKAMSFENAVYAVRQRGLFMEEAVPAGMGTMAAVLGMKADKLTDVCQRVTAGGDTVQLANLNSSSQIVISGTKEGVEKASALAREEGAKRVVPLNVSGPFHSDLMKPAAEKLRAVLSDMDIHDADIPVIANVTADIVQEGGLIYERLIEQLYSPVRWVETVERLKELGVDTYIEVGPGNVLSGLVKKVDRKAAIYQVGSVETCHSTIQALKERS
ncbi:[acyl-carrier-protein] S-malonyltransferase [Scopulibacillus darangshiensis]|uniref:Malonyl CoA-acyl carrier protein transacylase n=1 Tax=Scopulibacillus darangshiensis TaxID=442528 RepID=A0A4R2P5T5_9BACL|nr:ACP S-malonyltransferase [Scopulibacillus darangshiensis]TCP29145.1 [acyl-carrier-protein] S-malonyltransferase [Scopulibacillus darangshiensis]